MNLAEIKEFVDEPWFDEAELLILTEDDHFVSIDHKDEMSLAEHALESQKMIKWLLKRVEELEGKIFEFNPDKPSKEELATRERTKNARRSDYEY